MDKAVAASVTRYTQARERTLQELDRISAAAISSPDLPTFLPQLLQVLRETVPVVDAVVVLLLEGDELRVESVVGLQIEESFRVRVGEGVAGEVAATRQPATVRDVATDPRVRSEAVRDRQGQIAALVVTFVDVSELRRAEAPARRAAEFGDKLIGIVSHDLRNPLNAIHLSVTMLLQSEALPPREQRAAARIAKSTDRMKRRISELLDLTWGRIGGGIPIHRVPGDLRAVVRQGVEELEAAWPERTLQLRVDPGRYDPFRRVSSEGGGLGLGLYIVEQVVRGHGGRIEVTYTAESGTTFRVTLPRQERG